MPEVTLSRVAVRLVRLSSGCASAASEVNLKLAKAQVHVFTTAFEAGSRGVCFPWAELQDSREWLSPVSRLVHARVFGEKPPSGSYSGSSSRVDLLY